MCWMVSEAAWLRRQRSVNCLGKLRSRIIYFTVHVVLLFRTSAEMSTFRAYVETLKSHMYCKILYDTRANR
jgi:hypothetical protein